MNSASYQTNDDDDDANDNADEDAIIETKGEVERLGSDILLGSDIPLWDGQLFMSLQTIV